MKLISVCSDFVSRKLTFGIGFLSLHSHFMANEFTNSNGFKALSIINKAIESYAGSTCIWETSYSDNDFNYVLH